MSPHRLPGWTLPNGHLVRGNMEAALCHFLDEYAFPHLHAAGGFELSIGTGALRLYIPCLTLTDVRREGAEVIIEPIDSVHPGSGVRRLQGLRRDHGQAYFVIVIARQPLHPQVPADAYDALFPLEDFAPLLRFLRTLR